MANDMTEVGTRLVTQILRTKSGTPDILVNRESSRIEFKASFSMASRADYAKTMAAFANNLGGYIVFGVNPKPHQLVGVNGKRFLEKDPADFAKFLDQTLAPALEWESGTVELAGRDLGYIWTSQALEKPVVATANLDGTIREGEIYYRYNAHSRVIRYAELRQILDYRLNHERKAWIRHLTTISKAGPINVGILDVHSGTIVGGGQPLLIHEDLLKKLKFIREGSFDETRGAPSLRVVGDVKPIGGVRVETVVPQGIHSEDLIRAFLMQEDLSVEKARSYLKETVFQNTHYVPIHYFARFARLGKEGSLAFIAEVKAPTSGIRDRLMRRLEGKKTVAPIGTIDPCDVPEELTSEQWADLTPLQQRSLLAVWLRKPEDITEELFRAIGRNRLFEAITHLNKEHLKDSHKALFSILLTLFESEFDELSSASKSAFRKAIAFCDETLFMSRGT